MSKREQERSVETVDQRQAKEIAKALEEGPQDDYERYLRSENGRVLFNSPSSIWNLLFFSETNKVLNYGEKNRYEIDSLFRVDSDLTHKEISPELNKQYSEALKKDPNASYYEQVFKVVRKNQITGACIFGSAFIFQLFNPLFSNGTPLGSRMKVAIFGRDGSTWSSCWRSPTRNHFLLKMLFIIFALECSRQKFSIG